MPNLVQPIATIRDSIVAVLRIHTKQPAKIKKGRQIPAQFQLAVVGTAWCIVPDTYLVTAHHVLNDGKPREPSDRFYVFSVPQNGPVAFHFPVTGFVLEDPKVDMAVLQIGSSITPGVRIPACSITFSQQQDGARVLTYGFPAPTIASAQVDQNGNWIRGDFFLKAHANEGIVAAKYDIDGVTYYELNVGWHHGEGGGPIFSIDDGHIAAFAIMQSYRNVQSPHGVMAGPHIGRSLSAIEQTLRQLGANVI